MHSPVHGLTVLEAEPEQSLPPFRGAGSVQVRVSVLVPPPQVTEQVPVTQEDQDPSTGEQVEDTTQVLVWLSLPTQSAPPLAGAGLLHSLESLLLPLPQVTEQVPLVQADQPPSTAF